MVGPRILPPGAQWSFLDGTPNDTSFFTIRVRMPANYRIPPHVHTNDEYITVIFGKFHIGIGSVMDTRQAKRLSVDGFVRIPAGTPHYAWTTEETIIQIYSVGPWSHEYIQSNTHTQRGSPAEAPTVD
jgi:quercetin dioxygenase-like cupin family protein